ncbi:hypothetical protein [Zavarzinella formosa]|uniref:hypothetical protein n=1 Tax=Zavarzinella formosa TaxID=360055 RepID=UPI0002DDD3EC|nr:hypothetical protein [Zavarzinella formosa]
MKDLPDLAAVMSPRSYALVCPPEIVPTARLKSLLASVGRELRRILPEFEKDADITVCVWPLAEDGEKMGMMSREFEIPVDA